MFNGQKKSLYNNMTVQDISSATGRGGAKGAIGSSSLKYRVYRKETCGSSLCSGLPIITN